MKNNKWLIMLFSLFMICVSSSNLKAYDIDRNKYEIANDLRKYNISWENIAGIMSSIRHESNYDPSVFQKHGGKSCIDPITIEEGLKKGTESSCGFGLFQYDSGRRFRVLTYLNDNKIDINNIWEQISYMVKEYDWRVRTAPKMLNQGPIASGQIFAQNFERCAKCHPGEQQFIQRGEYALELYKELQSVYKFELKLNQDDYLGWHKNLNNKWWYGTTNNVYRGWHWINGTWFWFYKNGELYTNRGWDKFKSGYYGYSDGSNGYVTSKSKYIWSSRYNSYRIYIFNNNAYWVK